MEVVKTNDFHPSRRFSSIVESDSFLFFSPRLFIQPPPKVAGQTTKHIGSGLIAFIFVALLCQNDQGVRFYSISFFLKRKKKLSCFLLNL